jgi:hypothetical protein
VLQDCVFINSRLSFSRFHKAQASPVAGYDTALAEIRRGRKTGHWIWYVFPQIEGLGRSSPSLRQGYASAGRSRPPRRSPAAAGRRRVRVRFPTSAFLILTFLLPPSSAPPPKASLVKTRPSTRSQRCDSILGRTSAQGYPPCAQTLARVTG